MRILSFLSVFVLLLIGCEKPAVEFSPKAAHPVNAMTLKKSAPATSYEVSGTVKSWKTEQIGFEVAGRVQWVLEPGKNVDGRITDADQNLISEGTPLAKIDPVRYEIAVQSATAALDVATMDKQIVQIRYQDTIPADIESASADARLAEDDFARIKRLQNQNAVSQAEYDQVSTRLQTQKLRLTNLRSSLKQASAELKAAEARITVAQQNLEDAQRDLEHTVLYASYRGQISEVHVVPGSVISAGSAVLTLQMMDPIKVEIEVSAEQSRLIQRRRQVPVRFTMPEGTDESQMAMVYVVDPSADASTRTFTVTLLILNKQYRPELPESLRSLSVARAAKIWPLNLNEVMGTDSDAFLVEENMLEHDDQGHFLWVMDGIELMQTMPDVMKVRKHYVERLGVRIPFLGNWVFQPVKFLDAGNDINSRTLIAGNLEFPEGNKDQWDGQSVVFDSGQHWMLRPGDLVHVNLGREQIKEGYYVPVEAIYEESGETFVFVIDENVARKTEIKVDLPDRLDTASTLRIDPLEADRFSETTRIVVDGVHFLKDGDKLFVLGEKE
ncbi:Multidrug resistance protein MdtE precursor [Planctomycetes bacterium CA13]|uniref:Multidrug resistance protein MdtE n=1 Tax=Novipirellula herctigrandis TaxID=2527986 RepID=A0A5C5Z5Y2_9BACT|nr:Multidrug resistance protein MdtE precursor [Planctomycetes bacterium CA13]